MNKAIKAAMDRIARAHGFEDSTHVASIAPHPLDGTGVLMQEIRHPSCSPVKIVREIEAARDGEQPTQRLLAIFEERARLKRSLIGREVAMVSAGHSRLKTPFWALRAHALALAVMRHAGARYAGEVIIDPSEQDPTEPNDPETGWRTRGGMLKGDDDSYELRIDACMTGDMLIYECITIVGLPENMTKALLTCSAEGATLSVRSDMPESTMPSLVGRDVAEVASHPAWGAHAGIRIIAAEMDRGGDVPWMDLMLEPVFEWIEDVPAGIDSTWRS